MEMTTSLPALFDRYPTLELAAEPVRRPGFVLRGYESVILRVA
jgi:cytochrome P450